ncbi:nuclease-related domain-containing protein [Neobacillus dielmonensis]|uniref:nuclease-related domain-containing protein n=1 Tax=Neobacillus dielmonensis TaxID=1347369 RepID=UPI0009DE2671|nr:nuclease-related domain-containing protein [Neobacillus dielmonensis]
MEVLAICTVKERDPSFKLQGLLAGQARLPASHPLFPVLAAKQSALEAGIGGEERVAEVLRKCSLPFEHQIFHDLSPASDECFQMDTYVFTPWFGLVLEAKNIAGILEFHDNPPQLIRIREDGHQDGFESPVAQLERNCELLRDWNVRHNVKLPIYGAVVVAYPRQIVAVAPAKTKVLFPSSITSYIKKIPQQSSKLEPETFNWLSHELLTSHRPFIPKPLSESYGIPFSDFIPGVRCFVCGRIGMVKLPRTWHCPFCGANDHLAHVAMFREWFLIFKRSITNQECRWFLGIEDIHTASRILQSMGFPSVGAFRYREYMIELF